MGTHWLKLIVAGLLLPFTNAAAEATTIQQIPNSQTTGELQGFVGNGLVAWQSGADIDLYNIATGITNQDAIPGGNFSLLAFDGYNAVLSVEGGGTSLFNIASQTNTQISTSSPAQGAISGNYVVYSTFLSTGYEQLYRYNISTQATVQLNNPSNSYNGDPSVNSSGQVAWDQTFIPPVGNATTQVAYYDGTLYKYNLSGTPNTVPSSDPSISSDIIAFSEDPPNDEGSSEEFVYSIANGTIQQLTYDLGGNEANSADGDNVVWWSGPDAGGNYVMIFDGSSTNILTDVTP